MNPRKIMSELAEIKKLLLSQSDSADVVKENDDLKREVTKLAKELGKKESEIKKLKKFNEDK